MPLHLMLQARWLVMSEDAPAHQEDSLVARCAQGDEESFRVIFERYAGSINGFIYSMVTERDLAEELTQETFVRAYVKISTIRDPSKLSTWLFGIAKNVAREALSARRSRARTHVEINDAALNEIGDSNSSPTASVLNKELHKVMLAGLAQLDEDKRQVFTLKVFHQLRYDEIMEVTGFSLSKVKSDLHRARGEMQRLISAYTEQTDEL
jgi:RNA polymerase sigma-70 factor, ECF subfamily